MGCSPRTSWDSVTVLGAARTGRLVRDTDDDVGRIGQAVGEPGVERRLGTRSRRHRDGTRRVRRVGARVEVQGEAMRERQAGVRRVDDVRVGRVAALAERRRVRRGSVEVPEHDLVDALRQDEVGHRVIEAGESGGGGVDRRSLGVGRGRQLPRRRADRQSEG